MGRSAFVAPAAADREAWAALAERARHPNPYFHPDFVLPAAAFLAPDERVSVAVGGAYEAVLPVRHGRWRGLPVPGVFGWMHDQCFLGTPLVASDAGWSALLEVLGGRGLLAEIDLAALGALPGGAIPFGAVTRAAVERRPEHTYLEAMSGKHRRANRRLARDLAEALGGEPVLVDHAGDEDAVERFLALEDAGWKGERGTSLLKVRGGRGFLHAMCASFAARGALQLLFLELGDRVVAMRLNLRAGREIFCFKIAMDESLRPFSPGLQMELAMLDHFHADLTADRMDSCADPGSDLFNRLWPDRKALSGVVLPRTRAAGPALRAVANQITKRRAAD